jgi:RNA-directed DNA polymerase
MGLLEGKMSGSSSLPEVSTKLRQIAKLARENPEMVITTLAHHIDYRFVYQAYLHTRPDGAAGVDGVGRKEYVKGLRERLESLLTRLKTGTYRAPAVKRVNIPKADGKTRPIGIPTYEDKLLQRAVAMILEAVYEQEFLDCSYGFRPGRSAHQALSALWEKLMKMHGAVVIEVDIRSFFDSLDHGQLRAILDRRVRDGVLRRVIDKWLAAGVLEEGQLSYPKAGTPQGGIISPLLANIYLHEVLDQWFMEEVRPRLGGEAHLIRYADDFVMVFASPRDAERVMEVLAKRLAKYNLSLHPEKTRMLDFTRPPYGQEKSDRGSFDFLGFTHFWGRSRKGNWVVVRNTAKKRFNRAAKAIGQWCRSNRHQPVREQWRQLKRKLHGHDAYYGITGNWRALALLRTEVRRIWERWIHRRGQKNPGRWERMAKLLERLPLPPPRVVHSVLHQPAKP